MRKRRRVGATLLVVGGLADLARVIVVQFLMPSLQAAKFVVAAVNLTPPLLVAIGCIVLGLSYGGRGRVGLLIAGAFGGLLVAVNAIQIALGSPFGPAPSQLASVLSGVAILGCAAVLLSDRSLRGPFRWAFAIPAGCTLLFVLSALVLPLPGLSALPSVGYVVAGYLLLRHADCPAATEWRASETSSVPSAPT